MAADQHKKRVNSGSLVGCTSREQYRVKRKKLEWPLRDLKIRPNISLEWDKKKKCVVSKKEQIGISRRHLFPFFEAGPHVHNILADVFSVPQEIYELENLSEVLTYEVWDSYFSEKERTFLSKFIPKEVETDRIVRELLAGDNFHFGNPFLQWGASLCLGELHPDNVIQNEESLRVCKKAYYSDIQKYHMSMIEILQMWKEKWASCQDPELDVVHNTGRPRKHGEKKRSPSENRFYDIDENLVATPEPCYWANSEKLSRGDNQDFGFAPGESQQRKSFLNKILDDSLGGVKMVSMARKGEKIQKRNIQRGDGAKYMSYIKVSKEQHERIKSSMKHAGNGIQPRSLNNVLGSIDALNVQPFERFEEEERTKLHAYWLQLANKDIPEGFAHWRKRQLRRQQLTESLVEKIEKRKEANIETEKGDSGKLTEISDDSEEESCAAIMIEAKEKAPLNGLPTNPADNEEKNHEMIREIEDEKEITADNTYEELSHDETETTGDNEPNSVMIQDCDQKQIASINDNPRVNLMMGPPNRDFLPDQHGRSITSLNGDPRINSVEMGSHGSRQSTKTDVDRPLISEYAGNLNHTGIHVGQGDPLPSAGDIWSAGDVNGSYYQSSAAKDGFVSSQELSLGHQQQFIQEQPMQILDLGTDRLDGSSAKNTLRGQPDDISFFSSYSNKDRNELLQSFFEGHSSLTYHHEPKQPGFEFQHEHDLMIDAGQFPRHLREQIHPSLRVDLRQKRLNDLYMHQNIQESIYSDGSRYGMTRQDNLPVGIHDWSTVNAAGRLPAPPQLNLNAGELTQNWYAGTNAVRDGWPAFEGAGTVSHNISSGSNSDQTLFSVVSECNELRPGSGYDSMGSMSTERFIQTGNYGGGMAGGIPSSSNMLHQSSNPLNYLSGHEAAAGLKMNNGHGWIGMPQQNSGMQESMGKPFLRSWNQ